VVAARQALMRGRAALAVALAVVAAGCGGSGDKAGGREETLAKPVAPVGKPVTLTLVAVDAAWASEYAAAAKRLSGDTIRIDIRFGGSALVDYERRLVDKVRAGEADLASVGARAWDRMGVTSMRALVAPFLVDSLAHQQRVLDSSLVEPMLEGVEPLGLVGLAVLPGPLRRPLGLSRSLVGPPDYAGAVFGIRYGGVARDSIGALGATAKAYRIGSLAKLDGAELDLQTIAGNGYDARGSRITANVVLWARPETIVISRAAFDRLPAEQREVLRRAGGEALAPALARIEKEQEGALEVLCGRGNATFPTASPSELAALRAAVQPVYDELERDAQTREFIAQIRKLRGGVEGESVHCAASQRNVSQLEGVWESTVTRAELVASGASAAEAASYSGPGTFQLRDGRWTFRGERATIKGTYAATGNALRLTILTCTTNPCTRGAYTDYTWNVYNDTLTLRRRPGQAAWARPVAKPSRRVG
jgi:TRAP-type C4-dicarboxylate transport system substrate-binding protein